MAKIEVKRYQHLEDVASMIILKAATAILGIIFIVYCLWNVIGR